VALISSFPDPLAARAISTNSPLTLRNVTAVATGAFSIGLALQNIDDTTSLTVDAKNVIARGAQNDLWQLTGGHTAANSLAIDYSNYRSSNTFNSGGTFNPGSHNQTSVDPIFTSDGYHEAASSPTIGAGVADASRPPFDIDGDVRYVGATDIGADQYVRPGAQAIGQTSTTADSCPAPPSYAQTQFSVQGPPSYTATSDGVITSWSMYVGAVDLNTVAELKVFSPDRSARRASSSRKARSRRCSPRTP